MRIVTKQIPPLLRILAKVIKLVLTQTGLDVLLAGKPALLDGDVDLGSVSN
jgi:hypothetical protein